MKELITIRQDVSKIRERLLNHPMYHKLNSPSDVRLFMEHHVFAVWDFMSLLKALQIQLTCVTLPWAPKGDPEIRHMINEIVLGEESDEACGGKSHFEWYLEAMEQAGANRQPIEAFINLAQSTSIETALEISDLPQGVEKFLKFTFGTIFSGKIHCIAAAFTSGRENLIPGMFPSLVSQAEHPGLESFSTLLAYLERHIEVDGDDHGPLAERMLNLLCDNDPQKLSEARETTLAALEARDHLWNGVLKELEKR